MNIKRYFLKSTAQDERRPSSRMRRGRRKRMIPGAGNANSQLSESIRYAKRIQEAVLPLGTLISDWFPESGIFYQPKDTVSGDFYWFSEKDGKRVVVVADCTGHGVPGAFMSLLGSLLLNFIVNERNILDPAGILGAIHKELRITLKQYEDLNDLPDGMDISVCVIDTKACTLDFAGANQSVFLLRHNGDIFEIKGDRQGIGGKVLGKERVYTQQRLDLRSGDKCFLLTDGFRDQFGGRKNKKLGKKGLYELLYKAGDLTFSEAFTVLRRGFLDWKGRIPQTDDVLLLGFEIPQADL